MLEDQLCAFTTAGYRGEGSPDHADALVFAISELMLAERRCNSRILSATGAESGARAESTSAAGDREGEKDDRAGLIRLIAPGREVSIVHGLSGTYYMADADGSFAVKSDDAVALLGHGFMRVDELEKMIPYKPNRLTAVPKTLECGLKS